MVHRAGWRDSTFRQTTLAVWITRANDFPKVFPTLRAVLLADRIISAGLVYRGILFFASGPLLRPERWDAFRHVPRAAAWPMRATQANRPAPDSGSVPERI